MSMFRFRNTWYWTTILVCLLVRPAMAETKGPVLAASDVVPDPAVVAREVETLLRKELGYEEQTPPAKAQDLILLRRMSLDLTGRIPGPKQVVSYSRNEDAGKFIDLAERMIESDAFADRWARYWRDAIVYRRTEPRVLQFVGEFEAYLHDAFAANRPWSEIVQEIITAEGDAMENPDTVLIVSQGGQPEDVASEVSRLFTGIQIQCAQCHNHPWDRWSREQFHHFAAFFPRIAARPDMTDGKRSFVVTVNDRGFSPPRNNANRFVGSAEHYMNDLNDPAAKGTLMKPDFFLTDQGVPLGTPDAIRRGRLASWFTSPKNPWFAKALVNRLWSELIGRGFYDHVDDIGPDRTCHAPQALDHLAKAFEASGYDYRWLVKTIVHTEAYQSESVSRGDTMANAGLVQSVAQPLTSDQLLDALADVLDIPVDQIAGAINRRGGGRAGLARMAFAERFGFDPSAPRDEYAQDMSEVLALLNGPLSRFSINMRREPLSRLALENPVPVKAVDALYVHTLCRYPDANERLVAARYLMDSPDGMQAAYEDLLWALINTAEFRTRR